MRTLTEAERADLLAELTRVIWWRAAALAGVDPTTPLDIRPADAGRTAALAAIAIAEAAGADLAEVATSAARWAAEHGADYADLGAAAGISRQGARRRWPGLALAQVTANARAGHDSAESPGR
jgi:hypothetical protein